MKRGNFLLPGPDVAHEGRLECNAYAHVDCLRIAVTRFFGWGGHDTQVECEAYLTTAQAILLRDWLIETLE